MAITLETQARGAHHPSAAPSLDERTTEPAVPLSGYHEGPGVLGLLRECTALVRERQTIERQAAVLRRERNQARAFLSASRAECRALRAIQAERDALAAQVAAQRRDLGDLSRRLYDALAYVVEVHGRLAALEAERAGRLTPAADGRRGCPTS